MLYYTELEHGAAALHCRLKFSALQNTLSLMNHFHLFKYYHLFTFPWWLYKAISTFGIIENVLCAHFNFNLVLQLHKNYGTAFNSLGYLLPWFCLYFYTAIVKHILLQMCIPQQVDECMLVVAGSLLQRRYCTKNLLVIDLVASLHERHNLSANSLQLLAEQDWNSEKFAWNCNWKRELASQ